MDEIKSKPHLMLLVRRQLIGYMRILQRVSAFYKKKKKKRLKKLLKNTLIGPTPKSIETNIYQGLKSWVWFLFETACRSEFVLN